MDRPLVTVEEIQEFKRSRVWERFQFAIEERRRLVEKQDLRNLDGVPLYRAQGAAKELDWIALLPNIVIQIIQTEAAVKQLPKENPNE